MVAYSLKQVAGHSGIEKTNRKLHELCKKIGKKRNVYSRSEVEENPAPYEVDGCHTESEHELSKKNEPDKAYVSFTDTNINNALREKRKTKLQQASEQQTAYYLNNKLSVGF